MTNHRPRDGRSGLFAGLLLGLVTLVLAGQVAWGAAPAAAHSDVVWSFPSNGSTVSVPPAQVVLELAEPFDARLSEVVVTDPDGARPEVADLSVSRTGELVATLSPGGLSRGDRRGAWRVDYRVVSADGHVVTGRIDFGVGAPAETPTVSRTRWVVGLGGVAVLLLVLLHLRRTYASSTPAPAEVATGPVHEADRAEARVD
ncbi:MAG TPA: copper resistance CopC family protein [Nocardioides sp.]